LGIGEAIKYVVLWLQSRRHNLSFARDDLALSIAFVLSIPLFRELLFQIGLTPDLHALFPWIATMMGQG
jgi:hypothetical protein